MAVTSVHTHYTVHVYNEHCNKKKELSVSVFTYFMLTLNHIHQSIMESVYRF